MIRRSLVALSLLPLSALAQTQVPNVFEDGKPAKAAEVNENFQYVLENASGGGGCSATQQDNSVLIECADGSSGVIAGAGTVVVYPVGQIGEVPPDTLPTGEVVWSDANGVVLAEVYTVGINNFAALGSTPEGGEIIGHLVNYEDTESVIVKSACAGCFIYYLEPDCSGTPYGWKKGGWNNLLEINGTFFTPSTLLSSSTLFRGARSSAGYDKRLESFFSTGECEQGDSVLPAYALSQFTPAPEILNAAYPVRLEQLP